MAVEQLDPRDRRARKEFIKLEHRLLADEPRFIFVTDSDVDKQLGGKSPFFEETDHTLFVASNGSGEVARCAALVNRRWQRHHGEQAGAIGYFAAGSGAGTEIAEMLDAAEQWLRERGATRVIAPFNGSAILGLGVLTDAFDESPMFPLNWTPSAYSDYLEAAGYKRRYPLWIFDVDFDSERYRETSRAAIQNAKCEIRTFDKKRWDEEIELLRRVFNTTFAEEWEFYPLTESEWGSFFKQMKPIMDQEQYLFAEVDSQIAGFCFGMPDLNPLVRSFRGRMGPIQIVRMLLGARRIERAGLLAIGVLDEHRGKQIGQTLAAHLYRYYEQRGLRSSYYYPVNDVNLGSRRLAESFGASGRILYHAYDKPLR